MSRCKNELCPGFELYDDEKYCPWCGEERSAINFSLKNSKNETLERNIPESDIKDGITLNIAVEQNEGQYEFDPNEIIITPPILQLSPKDNKKIILSSEKKETRLRLEYNNQYPIAKDECLTIEAHYRRNDEVGCAKSWKREYLVKGTLKLVIDSLIGNSIALPDGENLKLQFALYSFCGNALIKELSLSKIINNGREIRIDPNEIRYNYGEYNPFNNQARDISLPYASQKQLNPQQGRSIFLVIIIDFRYRKELNGLNNLHFNVLYDDDQLKNQKIELAPVKVNVDGKPELSLMPFNGNYYNWNLISSETDLLTKDPVKAVLKNTGDGTLHIDNIFVAPPIQVLNKATQEELPRPNYPLITVVSQQSNISLKPQQSFQFQLKPEPIIPPGMPIPMPSILPGTLCNCILNICYHDSNSTTPKAKYYTINLDVKKQEVFKGALAIDLGTSSCCAEAITKQGKNYPLELDQFNQKDKKSLASIVFYKKYKFAKDYEAGKNASDMAVYHTNSYIHSPKRNIGIKDANYIYPIQEHQFIPISYEEATGHLFDCIAKNAQKGIIEGKYPGIANNDAVFNNIYITHPSRFNPSYIEKLEACARNACREVFGLNNVKITPIPEPVAAALSYLGKKDTYAAIGDEKEFYLMVYDCGGGTTDISLMRVNLKTNKTPDGNYHYEVSPDLLGATGNPKFGGENITECIQELIENQLKNGKPCIETSFKVREKAGEKEYSYQLITAQSILPETVSTNENPARRNEQTLHDWAEYIKIFLKTEGKQYKTEIPESSAKIPPERLFTASLSNPLQFIVSDPNATNETRRDSAIKSKHITELLSGKVPQYKTIAEIIKRDYLDPTWKACEELIKNCEVPENSKIIILLSGQASKWPQVEDDLKERIEELKNKKYSKIDLFKLPAEELKTCVAEGAAKYSTISDFVPPPEVPGVFFSIDPEKFIFSSASATLGYYYGEIFIHVINAGLPFKTLDAYGIPGKYAKGIISPSYSTRGKTRIDNIEIFEINHPAAICAFDCEIPPNMQNKNIEVYLLQNEKQEICLMLTDPDNKKHSVICGNWIPLPPEIL